jgi:hypothetical protein
VDNSTTGACAMAATLAQVPVPCSGRFASASLNRVPDAPLPRHLVPVLLPALVEVIVNLGLDDQTYPPPALLKAFSLTQCVLKSVRGRTTMNSIEKQIGFPAIGSQSCSFSVYSNCHHAASIKAGS